MSVKAPKGKFGLIHADPPWPFATRGKGDQVPARGEQPYETMTIAALEALPVRDWAADDAVLIMWTTSSNLLHCVDLATAWGFAYKSLGFVWEKTLKSDPEGEALKMGMGFWIRQEAEISFVFTRGKPKRLDAGVRQVIRAPAREHSRKPDETYPRCERLAAGPYLDLFGRCSRPGWTIWGNEADKFDPPKRRRWQE